MGDIESQNCDLSGFEVTKLSLRSNLFNLVNASWAQGTALLQVQGIFSS